MSDPTKTPRPMGSGPRQGEHGGVIERDTSDACEPEVRGTAPRWRVGTIELNGGDDRASESLAPAAPHEDVVSELEAVLARSAWGRGMLEKMDELARLRVRWGLAQELAKASAEFVELRRSRILRTKPIDLLQAEVELRNAQDDAQRWSAEAVMWRARVDALEADIAFAVEVVGA